MKRLLFVLLSCIFFTALHAQAYKFSGDWSGKISINDRNDPIWVRINIDGSKITQYFYDEDSRSWSPTSPVLARYDYNINNFMYFWMNNSTVWTETQTYMLSYVNDDKLYVVWSRQVNNIQQGSDYDVWSLQGSGYLTRRN